MASNRRQPSTRQRSQTRSTSTRANARSVDRSSTRARRTGQTSGFASPRGRESVGSQRRGGATMDVGRDGARRTSSSRTTRSGRTSARATQEPSRVTTVSVGAMSQRQRAERVRESYHRYVIRLAVLVGLVLALVISGVVVYNSNVLPVKQVTVSGVEHLTAAEMSQIAHVPSNTTLLRVDTKAIENNILRDAWVQEVDVQRVYPDTINLAVTEREIGATVEVGVNKGESTQLWAIATDGMWLCPIPDPNSEQAQTVSPQIYEDVETVLSITDVSYGVVPEIGSMCTDDSINNAIAIVTGMTTELKDQVVKVSATSTETTTLTLDNGIEIAFGKAEDIRTKERVCLKIMEEYPGQVAYINVRVASSPTWRSL